MLLLFPGREARGGAGALDCDAARRCFTGPPRQPSSRVSSRRRSSRTCRGRVVDVSCSCTVDPRVGGARGRGCGAAGGPRAAAQPQGGRRARRAHRAAAAGGLWLPERAQAPLQGRGDVHRHQLAYRAARREWQREDDACEAAIGRSGGDRRRDLPSGWSAHRVSQPAPRRSGKQARQQHTAQAQAVYKQPL